MKIEGSYAFEAPLDTVWEGLFDPDVLARTLPGCEKLERQGDQFLGEINVKMGPVQGKFQGKVDVQDVKDHDSYTMIIDGRGPAGFAKATARIRVSPDGSGTRLDYDSDVQVGGRIASVGQRLIDASSRAIVKQSLEGLHAQLKVLAARNAAPTPLPEITASAGVPAVTGAVPVAGVVSAPAARVVSAPVADAAVPLGGVPGSAKAPAAEGPSQAAFAFGVAKEVTKEILPPRLIAIAVALFVAIWLAYRMVRSG